MSRAYREKNPDAEVPVVTSPEMRKYCQRPGRVDENGDPIYFTEQSHDRETDVNEIIKKHDKMGIITHVTRFEAKFGDMTGLDFKEAADLVANAKSQFELLPSDVRKRFENDPGQLLKFMEDPKNRDEAIELGLISAETSPDLDGLGEHVKDGKKVEKQPEAPADPPADPPKQAEKSAGAEPAK